LLRINHASVWQVSEHDPDQLVMTHAYRDPNLKPLPKHPFLVLLREDSGEIQLVISNSGTGFDVETGLNGLGLTSMRDRVRLINGTIAIESKWKRGTTIHVCVPLALQRDSQQVAV
jgi:hypothetical protein